DPVGQLEPPVRRPGAGALTGDRHETYDRIGHGYATSRRPDPRIAARVHAALAGCGSILNVGAGAGSYEPGDRPVVALEPARAGRPPRGRGGAVADHDRAAPPGRRAGDVRHGRAAALPDGGLRRRPR